MTKKEMVERLAGLGIEAPANATKAELSELLVENDPEYQAEEGEGADEGEGEGEGQENAGAAPEGTDGSQEGAGDEGAAPEAPETPEAPANATGSDEDGVLVTSCLKHNGQVYKIGARIPHTEIDVETAAEFRAMGLVA